MVKDRHIQHAHTLYHTYRLHGDIEMSQLTAEYRNMFISSKVWLPAGSTLLLMSPNTLPNQGPEEED